MVLGTPLVAPQEQRRLIEALQSENALTFSQSSFSSAALKSDQVLDAQGRRRFHGAFTGGYSAGYFNTVGSAEGWAPTQSFSSSRKQRATGQGSTYRPQRVEDFMDEEDEESAGLSLHATKVYSGAPSYEKGSFHLPQEQIIGVMPPALLAALKPTEDDSFGLQILRRFGWRKGQGIGPRFRHKLPETLSSTEKAEEGATSFTLTPAPGAYEKGAGLEPTFPPRDAQIFLVEDNSNNCGIGFESTSATSAALGQRDPLKQKHNGMLTESQDDDEYSFGYVHDSKHQPDYRILEERLQVARERETGIHRGDPFAGFVIQRQVAQSQKKYPDFTAPSSYSKARGLVPRSSVFDLLSASSRQKLEAVLGPKALESRFASPSIPEPAAEREHEKSLEHSSTMRSKACHEHLPGHTIDSSTELGTNMGSKMTLKVKRSRHPWQPCNRLCHMLGFKAGSYHKDATRRAGPAPLLATLESFRPGAEEGQMDTLQLEKPNTKTFRDIFEEGNLVITTEDMGEVDVERRSHTSKADEARLQIPREPPSRVTFRSKAKRTSNGVKYKGVRISSYSDAPKPVYLQPSSLSEEDIETKRTQASALDPTASECCPFPVHSYEKDLAREKYQSAPNKEKKKREKEQKRKNPKYKKEKREKREKKKKKRRSS